MKQLTGGDTVAARFLHQEFFEFRPQFKLWLATNHKPTVHGTDHAIWRRIRLIPFTVTIPESDRDPTLLARLKAERPGILGWALQGCCDWQRNGLGTAPAVLTATEGYRGEMDVLAGFLDDRCIVAAGARSTATELYQAYLNWCREMGERAVSQKAFGLELAERGFRRVKTRQANVWHGVAPQSPAPDVEDLRRVEDHGRCPGLPPVRPESQGKCRNTAHVPPPDLNHPPREPEGAGAWESAEGVP